MRRGILLKNASEIQVGEVIAVRIIPEIVPALVAEALMEGNAKDLTK